jgi:hypothetical protein
MAWATVEMVLSGRNDLRMNAEGAGLERGDRGINRGEARDEDDPPISEAGAERGSDRRRSRRAA